MSTRSRIGILNEDGSVDSIYCHHDGYLSYNGNLLLHYYNTEDKIRELLRLCDISGLEKTIEKTKAEAYNENGENTKVRHSANEAEFYKIGEEYNYLFKNGKWTVDDYENGIVEVTDKLISQRD